MAVLSSSAFVGVVTNKPLSPIGFYHKANLGNSEDLQ
jgi:hypothetical protein